MRLSAFNLYIEDHPAPGSTLVYNTFTGGFAQLEADELARLRRADRGEPLDVEERGLIDPLYSDPEVGVLVDDRESEERAFRAWYERRREGGNALTAIVSISFACNLDCTYCCQSDVLDGSSMSEATCEATAAWLAGRARSVGASRIHVDFVGGEPLLYPGRVERIVAGLRDPAQTGGLRFTFGLITNGVFLTRELALRWKPLGLVKAQVTLDGDETTHAMTRRSKKRGEDSFPTIFANVLAVADLIEVNINGNYQTDTAHGFVPLARKLAAAGFKRGSHVHFSPALTALGAPSDSASGSCSWSGSSPELMLAMSDEVRRAGFDPGDPMVVGPCGFHARHNFAVDPEGNIYKCPGFLGHAEWAIGDVRQGLDGRYDRMVGHDVQGACGGCAHRPDCGGGCVAATWMKQGHVEGVNCEVGYFEANKDELVKRKFALATADTPEEALASFPPSRIEVPRAAGRTGVRPAALRVLAA